MMAYQSGPSGPAELPPQVVGELRTMLAAFLADPEDGIAAEGTLRQVADAARERKLGPEQLLIVLKDVWYDVASSHVPRDPGEHTRLLQRLVTLSIKAYYE